MGCASSQPAAVDAPAPTMQVVRVTKRTGPPAPYYYPAAPPAPEDADPTASADEDPTAPDDVSDHSMQTERAEIKRLPTPGAAHVSSVSPPSARPGASPLKSAATPPSTRPSISPRASAASTPPKVPPLPSVSRPQHDSAQSSDRPTMDGAPDAIAWLYSEGKLAFDRKEFGEALSSFEFCLHKLAAEHARHSNAPFDPHRTGYRHLDDYLELCRTREAVALNRRQPTTEELPLLQPSPPPSGATGSLPQASPYATPRNGSGAYTASPLPAGSRSRSDSPLKPAPVARLERETLIFVCSPRHSPLPHLADEAVDVANVIPSRIRRGGSADELRNELLAHRYRAFLFSGHGDAELDGSGEQRTLGFTSASGGLDTVRPEHLAELLGAHSPSKNGSLETVFLNGCRTERIAAQVRVAGVPFVVCWRTQAHDKAARLLASTFFASLAAGRGHELAFEDACSAVKLVTRPGRMGNGVPSSVPLFELKDPHAPSEHAPPSEVGFTPPPMAAGIPLLLCDSRDVHI